MSRVYVAYDALGQPTIEDWYPDEHDDDPAYQDHVCGPGGVPKWAIKAGRVMYAISQPHSRISGWQAFAVVVTMARAGNQFAKQVREGIRRIAVALQHQRGLSA